jgi:hypothetical protein
MNTFALWGCNFLLALVLVAPQHAGSSPTIPAPFPAPESPGSNFPIDQPPVVVHGDRRQRVDPKRMKQQSAELAKLAQSVSPDIDKVSKGEMPKDLIKNLKQIEKLSKQLRRELGR